MNPFIAKLEYGARLTDEDRATLSAVSASRRHVEAHQDLIRQGDAPNHVHLVIEGYACRCKIQPDGTRHIVAYLIPGDWCDLHIAILGRMDHSIATMTPCILVEIPPNIIEELTANHRPHQSRPLVGDADRRGHIARVACQYGQTPG